MASLWANGTFRFYAVLAACLLLMYIPVVGRYFRMLSTMVHEGGHVLMALVLGEKPKKVELFKDTSGVALVKTSARWKALLVSLAGYTFTPLVAWLSFLLWNRGYQTEYLWGVVVLTAIFLLSYIRNGFGIFWSLSFIALHLFLIYRGTAFWTDVLVRLDMSVLFVDAVCSCLILLWVALRNARQSGDAYNVSKITHIPPFLTALLFTFFAVYVDYQCVLHFFPK